MVCAPGRLSEVDARGFILTQQKFSPVQALFPSAVKNGSGRLIIGRTTFFMQVRDPSVFVLTLRQLPTRLVDSPIQSISGFTGGYSGLLTTPFRYQLTYSFIFDGLSSVSVFVLVLFITFGLGLLSFPTEGSV